MIHFSENSSFFRVWIAFLNGLDMDIDSVRHFSCFMKRSEERLLRFFFRQLFIFFISFHLVDIFIYIHVRILVNCYLSSGNKIFHFLVFWFQHSISTSKLSVRWNNSAQKLFFFWERERDRSVLDSINQSINQFINSLSLCLSRSVFLTLISSLHMVMVNISYLTLYNHRAHRSAPPRTARR